MVFIMIIITPTESLFSSFLFFVERETNTVRLPFQESGFIGQSGLPVYLAALPTRLVVQEIDSGRNVPHLLVFPVSIPCCVGA